MYLYRASPRTRLYALPLPVYVGADLRYLVLGQTPAHTGKRRIRASVSCDVPVYFPTFRWVLTAPTHGGMVQAEYTWLFAEVVYPSPIQARNEPEVE